MRASPMRLSMQIAPWAGAGGKVSAVEDIGYHVDLAEALQSGERKQRGVDLAFVAACSAVSRRGHGR